LGRKRRHTAGRRTKRLPPDRADVIEVQSSAADATANPGDLATLEPGDS
jgi:hypothetical protein